MSSRHPFLLFVLLAVGCKGETVVKPDPQTQSDLEKCQKALAEKDKLIKAEEDENARLMREKQGGGEIVVALEGNVLTVKPGKPGEVHPIDDKVAKEASQQFLAVVGRSRGEIQRCYEQALKRDQSLQARTVTLTVSASFGQAGTFNAMTSAPSLGGEFDNCLQKVAKRWTLPQTSPAMTFKAPVSLTPS
jgi:hypothetical protein